MSFFKALIIELIIDTIQDKSTIRLIWLERDQLLIRWRTAYSNMLYLVVTTPEIPAKDNGRTWLWGGLTELPSSPAGSLEALGGWNYFSEELWAEFFAVSSSVSEEQVGGRGVHADESRKRAKRGTGSEDWLLFFWMTARALNSILPALAAQQQRA